MPATIWLEVIVKRLLNVVVLAGFCLLMSERPAHAYLDAGTGAMILQVLLGGIAGVTVIFKLYWRRFRTLFSTRRGEDDVLDTSKT